MVQVVTLLYICVTGASKAGVLLTLYMLVFCGLGGLHSGLLVGCGLGSVELGGLLHASCTRRGGGGWSRSLELEGDTYGPSRMGGHI